MSLTNDDEVEGLARDLLDLGKLVLHVGYWMLERHVLVESVGMRKGSWLKGLVLCWGYRRGLNTVSRKWNLRDARRQPPTVAAPEDIRNQSTKRRLPRWPAQYLSIMAEDNIPEEPEKRRDRFCGRLGMKENQVNANLHSKFVSSSRLPFPTGDGGTIFL